MSKVVTGLNPESQEQTTQACEINEEEIKKMFELEVAKEKRIGKLVLRVLRSVMSLWHEGRAVLVYQEDAKEQLPNGETAAFKKYCVRSGKTLLCLLDGGEKYDSFIEFRKNHGDAEEIAFIPVDDETKRNVKLIIDDIRESRYYIIKAVLAKLVVKHELGGGE